MNAIDDDVPLDAYVSVEMLREGWFDVLATRIRLNGHEEQRLLIDHPSGAAVLLYDADRRVAFITAQTRDGPLWVGQPGFPEAVAGVTDDGEDAAQTARREAMEEVGVRPTSVDWIGRVWMTPSSTTERVDLYLASYCEADIAYAGGGARGENEHITASEIDLVTLWDTLNGADMADAKLLMLIQALRIRQPELFARIGDKAHAAT